MANEKINGDLFQLVKLISGDTDVNDGPIGKSYGLPVQLIAPLTAFGELSVAEKTPQVQVKFPAGLNEDVTRSCVNKSGSAIAAVDGLCTLTVAGTAEAYSQLVSLDVIRYGPGQGMNACWTAAFSAGLADSTLWAGAGDDDEMLAFGFNETEFSILHRKLGELEVRDLTITAGGDAGGGTFTLTLDGTPITITVPSGSATIADICALIILEVDDLGNAGRGWAAHTDDSITVTFTSFVAENATGTFSFTDVDSGVTTGTFNQATTDLEGSAPTENIIAQANWNIDKMDGTGPSGMTLDPTKLNVFDIQFQYLGAGNIFLSIEDVSTGRFQLVHIMLHAGTGTTPTFRNPTFRLSLIGKTDAGFSGAAQTIKSSSLAGFIEGKEAHFGVRHNASATITTNGTTEVVSLVLHNEETRNGTRNKVEVFPDHLTLINESTRSIHVDIYENPTHINSGVALTAVNSTSVLLAGTGVGIRTSGKLFLTVSLTASQSKDLNIEHLGLKMHPKDTWAFVVTKSSGGVDGTVTVGASWLERI